MWQKFSDDGSIIEACDCPFECKQSGYAYSTSLADFPTMISVDWLSSMNSIKRQFPNETDRNFDNFKQTLASVVIFYDELKETITTQDAKISTEDLVSNLGGILGLFLGFSIMSFGEVFEILFQSLIILFQKRKQLQSDNNKVLPFNA